MILKKSGEQLKLLHVFMKIAKDNLEMSKGLLIKVGGTNNDKTLEMIYLRINKIIRYVRISW